MSHKSYTLLRKSTLGYNIILIKIPLMLLRQFYDLPVVINLCISFADQNFIEIKDDFCILVAVCILNSRTIT